MRRFLIYSGYFISLLFVTNIILYFAGKKIYYGNYAEFSPEFNSYLFADSRGVVLRDHTEKYGTYNFSMGSDSYFDMKRKLNFLLKKINVDTVYITVDDHTLSYFRDHANNLDRSLVFSATEDFNSLYEYFVNYYLKKNIVFLQPKTRSVIKRYYSENIIKTFKSGKNKNQITKRPLWHERHPDIRKIRAENRVNNHFVDDIRSVNLEATLLEIINICSNNNITLIGVKFPLSADYIEVLGDRTFKADSVFYSNGLKVLDFKYLFLNNNEFFADEDHLNEEGSKKLVHLLLTN